MKKIYLLPILFFASCSNNVRIIYVGNAGRPVTNVDIFMDETQIKKPYEVMGVAKGEVRASWAGVNYDEKVARKAIERAKKCGADAVLFSNYYARPYGTETSQESKIIISDTSISRTASQKVLASPANTGRQILFLKYK